MPLGIGKGISPIFFIKRGGSVEPMTAITAVTTSAGQTLTLQQLTPTGGDCVVDWGDGGATSTITDGNTGTTTHVYAAAGTYPVTVYNPHLLTALDLRDVKIVFDSNKLGGLIPANLTTLQLFGLGAGSVFDSADFAGAMPTVNLVLRFLSAGTYTFDSADFAGAMPTVQLYFLFTQAGTYTFDSADFAGAQPITQLYIGFTQAGTYTFNSSNFAGAQPVLLTFLFPNSVTTTIARADWTGIVRKVGSPTIQMGLSSAEVDAVLLGIWDDFPNRTAAAGTLDVAGNNAAPTGALAAQCPPLTGKNAAFELVNDTCGVSANPYAAVLIST